MIPDTLTWIDTCYVQNILRKRENDESIKISNITVNPATVEGDNYMSDMYRVGVEFSRVLDGHGIQDKGSLIVKVAPMDKVREEMVLATTNCENLSNIYSYVDLDLYYTYENTQYAQDRLIYVIEVDFQISHHGSPAIDILYFLASSPTDDVRMNHRQKLLHEYHNSLTSTMAKLKCNTETLSFDDLQEILKRCALWEVIISIALLPTVLLDKNKARSLDELVLEFGGEYKHPGQSESGYRKIMTRLLPLYDSMGLLDV